MRYLQTNSHLVSTLGSVVFLVVAPGTIAGYVPWLYSHWRVQATFAGFILVRALGVCLLALGFALLMETFARFALQGVGTPAPILPTQHLVVTGSYRFVRNPMYVAVLSLILGQGLFFADWRVLVYGLAVGLAFSLFVLAYEQPALRKQFPADYAEYCAHVPAWIPRLTPWKGTQRSC
jgi:protein-S-isoprenylcysteine O-methyltransferase Ste14